MVKLCYIENNSVNAQCTFTLCTFWGLGIIPKMSSGDHASLNKKPQS